MSEWLSRSDDGFYAQGEKWVDALATEPKIAQYKWDKEECDAVIANVKAYLRALDAYKEVNSTANRIAKDATKKIAADSMRRFAASSVRHNPRMSDAARFELGLRPRDNAPTTHTRPTSQPSVIVENTVNYFEHRLKASNNETGSTSRPDDAYGVRFAWQVGGERPASGADLPKGRFIRRTVFVVSFSEAEQGLPVYYAACYENSRGEAGPWSPVVEARIR